jgi:hypothetical protein
MPPPSRPEPASLASAQAAAAVAQEQPQKVVYVLGAGHSGSTILGLTLGNCSGIFFAGELARWLRYDGKPPVPGERRASFWREVRETLDVDPDLLGIRVRPLEQSSGLFRVRSWRRQLRLRERYRRATEELFGATARAAGASYVVDTSHFPRRARQLQRMPGIELYLLFVVRDPQSVIASYGRPLVAHKQTWSMPTTNAYLWLTYAMSVPVFLRQPRERRLFVRHEQFIADPAGVLREILRQIGSSAELPDLSALDTGVPFQGNRLVRSDVVSLSPRPERPARGSRLTALLHAPWQALFSRLSPALGAASERERS